MSRYLSGHIDVLDLVESADCLRPRYEPLRMVQVGHSRIAMMKRLETGFLVCGTLALYLNYCEHCPGLIMRIGEPGLLRTRMKCRIGPSCIQHQRVRAVSAGKHPAPINMRIPTETSP